MNDREMSVTSKRGRTILAMVEQNPARYGLTDEQADAFRFLADPIEFSQNIARVLQEGPLMWVLVDSTPRQIRDLQNEFQFMIEQASERGDSVALGAISTAYTEFSTYAFGEVREYGVAIGAVLEQLREGLVRVDADLTKRGLTQGDVMTLRDLQRLRRQFNLSFSSAYDATDLSSQKEEAAK